MRIYSIIPCLHDNTGHHYTYHTTLSKVFKINNWENIKLIPKQTKLKNLKNDWKKVLFLHQAKKKKSFYNNFLKPLFNFFPLFKLLKQIKKDKTDINVCFFEYFTISHLLALYLAFFVTKTKCSIWLLYRTEKEQLFLNGKIHKILHQKIKNIIEKKNLSFFTDSSLVAEQLEAFFLSKFHILPIPHTQNLLPKISKKFEKNKIIVWWPGGSVREEKGLSYITDFAKKLAFQKKIILLIAKHAKNFIPEHPNIKFIKTQLNNSEYRKTMLRSDIILLPYSEESYKYRTSGIFVEAIIAGKIAIVTQNTWMAKELKKFDLSELITDWNNNNLLQYLEEVILKKDIQKKLIKMQKHYMSYHQIKTTACSFKNFFDKSLLKK